MAGRSNTYTLPPRIVKVKNGCLSNKTYLSNIQPLSTEPWFWKKEYIWKCEFESCNLLYMVFDNPCHLNMVTCCVIWVSPCETETCQVNEICGLKRYFQFIVWRPSGRPLLFLFHKSTFARIMQGSIYIYISCMYIIVYMCIFIYLCNSIFSTYIQIHQNKMFRNQPWLRSQLAEFFFPNKQPQVWPKALRIIEARGEFIAQTT